MNASRIFPFPYRRLITALLVAPILFVPLGCSDDDNPADPGEPSRVEGRVLGDGVPAPSRHGILPAPAAGVSGANVIITRMENSGSLEDISSASVQTSAAGLFAVETDVETAAGAKPGIVLVANKEGLEWKAVMTDNLQHGVTVYSGPLDKESTVEAEIWAQLYSDADLITYSDLKAMVNEEIAADVAGDDSEVAELATAIEAAADAHATILTDPSVGTSESELEAVGHAELEALVDLESALHAADEDAGEIAAAMTTYEEARIQAHVDAGEGAAAEAKGRAAAAEALSQAANDLEAGIQFMLRIRASEETAIAVDKACHQRFLELDAGDPIVTAVLSAGVLLRAAVSSATNEPDLREAFDTHRGVIVANLALVMPDQASAIVALDSSINEAGGARADLAAAVAAATSTDDITQAYLDFFASVRGAVEAAMSGASSAEIASATELLILTNLYAG